MMDDETALLDPITRLFGIELESKLKNIETYWDNVVYVEHEDSRDLFLLCMQHIQSMTIL